MNPLCLLVTCVDSKLLLTLWGPMALGGGVRCPGICIFTGVSEAGVLESGLEKEHFLLLAAECSGRRLFKWGVNNPRRILTHFRCFDHTPGIFHTLISFLLPQSSPVGALYHSLQVHSKYSVPWLKPVDILEIEYFYRRAVTEKITRHTVKNQLSFQSTRS